MRNLNKEYTPISYDRALSLIRQTGNAVYKTAQGSCGGKGLLFIDDSFSDKELLRLLNERSGYVVQERIRQHQVLRSIHEESINTLRITTMYYKGEMSILSAVLRMGAGKSKVDNSSSGGLFCGVSEIGCLRKHAFDKKLNQFTTHPTTGVEFEGIYVPGYDKCKELVIELAYRFLQSSQLISWDLAIDEAGNPILIEVNLKFGDIDFHQIANGPMFGSYTQKILDDVLVNL